MQKAKVLAGNLVWSMISQLSTRGSLVLSAMIVARYFDTNSFAAYGYFSITANLLATFSTLGFTVAASKFAAEYLHGGDGAARESLGILASCSVGFAALVASIILVAPEFWLPDNLGISRWALAAAIVAYSIQAVPNGIVLGVESFKGAAKNALAGSLVVVVGAVLSIITGHMEIALYAVIVGALLQGFANFALAARVIGLNGFFLTFEPLGRRMLITLQVVVPLATTSGITVLGMWLVGRMMLSGENGVYSFALYSIGIQWFALAMFVPGNVGTILLPTFIRNRMGGVAGMARSRQLKNSVLVGIAAAVLVALVGSGLSRTLLGLYGEAYASEVWLIPSFLFAAVLASPVIALGNALLAHDLHWQRVALYSGWIVVLLSTVSLDRMGGYSGALGLGLGYAFVVAGMIAVLRTRRIL